MKGTCCSWLQEWGGRNRIGCGSPVSEKRKKEQKGKKNELSSFIFSLHFIQEKREENGRGVLASTVDDSK